MNKNCIVFFPSLPWQIRCLIVATSSIDNDIVHAINFHSTNLMEIPVIFLALFLILKATYTHINR